MEAYPTLRICGLTPLHGSGQRDARGTKCREDPKEQAGEDCNCGRKRQHSGIERKIEKNRLLLRGKEMDKQHSPPASEEHTEQSAGAGEQNAFGEQLTDQARSRGAQGLAHGDLAFSSGSTREGK